MSAGSGFEEKKKKEATHDSAPSHSGTSVFRSPARTYCSCKVNKRNEGKQTNTREPSGAAGTAGPAAGLRTRELAITLYTCICWHGTGMESHHMHALAGWDLQF